MALIQCGQFPKIKKKTCPQGCLLGGQLVQRIKVGLRLLKPDFKGVFKCCEQLKGSDPILTPHPHPLDCVRGVRIGSDEVIS